MMKRFVIYIIAILSCQTILFSQEHEFKDKGTYEKLVDYVNLKYTQGVIVHYKTKGQEQNNVETFEKEIRNRIPDKFKPENVIPYEEFSTLLEKTGWVQTKRKISDKINEKKNIKIKTLDSLVSINCLSLEGDSSLKDKLKKLEEELKEELKEKFKEEQGGVVRKATTSAHQLQEHREPESSVSKNVRASIPYWIWGGFCFAIIIMFLLITRMMYSLKKIKYKFEEYEEEINNKLRNINKKSPVDDKILKIENRCKKIEEKLNTSNSNSISNLQSNLKPGLDNKSEHTIKREGLGYEESMVGAEYFNTDSLGQNNKDEKKESKIKYLKQKNNDCFMRIDDSIEDAYYKVYLNEDETEGEFEFCGDCARAIANRDATFDSVCERLNQNSTDNDQIITEQRGVVRKQHNGSWKVIEKAKVKFE